MHSWPFAAAIANDKVSSAIFHYNNFPRIPQTSFFFSRRAKHVAKRSIFIKYLQLKINNPSYHSVYSKFYFNYSYGVGSLVLISFFVKYAKNNISYLNSVVVGVSNNNLFISPTKTEAMRSIKLACSLAKLSKFTANLHLASFGISQIRGSWRRDYVITSRVCKPPCCLKCILDSYVKSNFIVSNMNTLSLVKKIQVK